MAGLIRGALVGLAAGAAGTTALNATTYVDMVMRARPASSTPETSVKRLSEVTGIQIPGDEQQRKNRIQGLGPMLGIASGLTVGMLVGVARATGVRSGSILGTLLTAAFVEVASNAPMTLLGVTDPRKWTPKEWAADVIPHLVYGMVTHATAVAADR